MDDLDQMMGEDMPEMSDDEMMDPMERAMLDRLDQLGSILNSLQQSIESMTQAFEHAGRPKKVVRGPDGRVSGIE